MAQSSGSDNLGCLAHGSLGIPGCISQHKGRYLGSPLGTILPWVLRKESGLLCTWGVGTHWNNPQGFHLHLSFSSRRETGLLSFHGTGINWDLPQSPLEPGELQVVCVPLHSKYTGKFLLGSLWHLTSTNIRWHLLISANVCCLLIMMPM